ncbi:ribbon-helix-helix domain-containing protein [Gordonia sp. HNM0687]|uniref:Ribbon-helix-helix domain-containing protein n=1 Tax=Gordonia mangrovi TaxID=2665643 RepID=A0A6L7GMU5_9ACTN|nr:ribbon-helix-helix domain-containing protein [Gordonia mangrovi]MXP21264.1 ribbon-helix-helix domain-containing protein [Gordonia mangrovi]UVF78208.1 ribbon-helix-helix domain-containing protein [Gordonia mangrovi]
MTSRNSRDYERMADAVEGGEYKVSGPLEVGATLKMGRPPVGERRDTTSRTVRLPAALDARLADYAEDTRTTPSEVLRRAVDLYLNSHPARRDQPS